jgi:hypothetical protein
MSVELIADLALRMSEHAGVLSGDALKLKSLELYVRGLEAKLALVSGYLVCMHDGAITGGYRARNESE